MEYVYILYSEIYYEPLYKKYFTILTLNKEPNGELKKYTKHIRVTSPSTKEETLNSAYCIIAISAISTISAISANLSNNSMNLMTLEQLDDFTQFIINNNYIINNTITQLYKNVLSINNKKRPIYAFMLKE